MIEPIPLVMRMLNETPEWGVSLDGTPDPEARCFVECDSGEKAGKLRDALLPRESTKIVQIVMSEFPGPHSQFIEAETLRGAGVCVGPWAKRGDGRAVLFIRVAQ